MTFVSTTPPGHARGVLAELYEQDRAASGFVCNHTQALSARPDAIVAFRALARAVTTRMEPRRFELVTLAAARALRSSYCMLAHGGALKRLGSSDAELAAIATDHHHAGLSAVEVALMDYADKVARRAPEITRADIEALRAHGVSDAEIVDVALAVALRCFYSTALDAVGAQADAAYGAWDESLQAALVVGRPICEVRAESGAVTSPARD